MANRHAVANGDWSNTATWNGGTLPTSADDVYANNFNINVNQNISVISLRNTAGTGITAGGTFTFNTAGITADISGTIVMNPTLTNQFILITASSGLVTMNIPNGIVNGLQTSNSNIINYTGNCSLTISCISFRGNQINTGNGGVNMLNKSSTGTLIFNGDVEARFGGYNHGYTINITVSSTNIINGNILGGSGVGAGSIAVVIANGNLTVTGNVTGGIGIGGNAISSSSVGIINITGNLIGGSTSAITVSNGTLNIIGTIKGGTVNGSVGATISGTGTLNHVGLAQASALGSAIACNTPTTSVITCTGPFLRNGYIVAVASQTLIINALSNPYFEFKKSDTTDLSYVNGDTLNFPSEMDVRDGTTYASGLYLGSLKVPAPSNVRKDVPTDNTVGTADLTAEDFWGYVNRSLTESTGATPEEIWEYTNRALTEAPDVPTAQEIATQVWVDQPERLRNVATVETTGDQIASI